MTCDRKTAGRTDGRYDLGRKCIRQRKQFFCAASNEEGI